MINSNGNILIVDDDENILETFKLILKSAGYKNIITCSNPLNVSSILFNENINFMLLDLQMPHKNGEIILSETYSHHPHIPIVIITSNNDINIAVECMKKGAVDFLVKPVEKEKLISVVKNVSKIRELENENKLLKERILTDELKHPEFFSDIITTNKSIISIFKYIESIAHSNQPVLINGETGTGKELFAASVHKASGRTGKFITVNIAGLDDNIFTDTLFGHKKGAYTSADSARSGLIKEAENGTLFLDEIGDLTPQSQVKILRLLQSGEYYPLGSDMPQKSTARIVAATNRNLEEAQINGDFRKDLYYRLYTHHITIPPLSERYDDLSCLISHFLKQSAATLGKKIPAYHRNLLHLLSGYMFPGNIRELESMVHDIVSINEDDIISTDLFKSKLNEKYIVRNSDSFFPHNDIFIINDDNYFPSLKEVEAIMIKKAMCKAGNNQTLASELLGITRQTLNIKLKSIDIF